MQDWQKPEPLPFAEYRIPVPPSANPDMARLEARIRGIAEGLTMALEILKQERNR